MPGPAAGRRDRRQTIVLGEQDVRTETASHAQQARLAGARLRRRPDLLLGQDAHGRRARVATEIDRAGPFDAYVLNSVQFAGAFETLFTDRPFLFVAHNAESISAAENARSARSRFQRFLFGRETRMLAALESRLCAKARFVFTLTRG